ncbi:MAG: hypothetical protein AB7L13_25145 [Acidimicrobiia bacterium]
MVPTTDLLPIVWRLVERAGGAAELTSIRITSMQELTTRFPLFVSISAEATDADGCTAHWTIPIGLRPVGEPIPTYNDRRVDVLGAFDTIWGDVYAYAASAETGQPIVRIPA